MAKNKNTNVLGQLTNAGNNAVGMINRLDEATGKFQKGRRQGSIVKAAQGNVFEFPVFISSGIPVDYATATSSLLEQIYASYLQMAISINPVVDADSVKNNMQFAGLKTDTNKYLEYTDMSYAHDACHAVYQEGAYRTEFDMISVEDADAKLINEAVDHQPLSEFDHFFQEATVDLGDLQDTLYPIPWVSYDHTSGSYFIHNTGTYNLMDPAVGTQWATASEIQDYLENNYQIPLVDIEDAIERLPETLNHYHLRAVSTYDLNNATNDSDAREMNQIRQTCSVLTPEQLALPRNAAMVARINDLDTRNPGFAENMRQLTENVRQANERADSQENRATIEHNLRFGNRPGRVTAANDIDNQRDINAQRASQARSRYYNTANAIDTAAKTTGDVAGAVGNVANAIYNVGTLGTRIKNEKLKNEQLKKQVANMDEELKIKRQDLNVKTANALKAPQYVNDKACEKLNTMKPLLMQVTLSMINKDDTIQPINYIIGVKTHNRVVPSSVLPEVAKYPLKEMDKISRKIKWRAGELKFLKDIVFRINEKKQTAADSRDPKRKWYRRLYELAHMKGDAPAAAVVQGKSIFASFIRDKQGKSKMMNGVIPNATIVMSQADVDNIKNATDIDLLKGSVAKEFCGELFLICLVIIDTDAESVKLMLPDMNDDYEVHSLASINKQLATLDTAGTKTRDMFKLLG